MCATNFHFNMNMVFFDKFLFPFHLQQTFVWQHNHKCCLNMQWMGEKKILETFSVYLQEKKKKPSYINNFIEIYVQNDEHMINFTHISYKHSHTYIHTYTHTVIVPSYLLKSSKFVCKLSLLQQITQCIPHTHTMYFFIVHVHTHIFRVHFFKPCSTIIV